MRKELTKLVATKTEDGTVLVDPETNTVYEPVQGWLVTAEKGQTLNNMFVEVGKIVTEKRVVYTMF